MRQLERLLPAGNVILDLDVTSKKRVFEHAGLLFENTLGISRSTIFDALLARERLGSTGLGHGVAIPHGRVKGSQHVQASFIRLKKPLPFDAVDGQPVDLLFCLAVPEDCGEDHLKLLAQVAELFSDPELLQKLRDADSAGRLLQLLSGAAH